MPIFRQKILAVIGGGDSAIEEATYLTKFAHKVILIVRRDVLRASKAMQKKIQENPKVEILWNSNVLEALGENVLEKLLVVNNKTKEKKTIEVRGLFYAIGHTPNTTFLENQLDLDEAGYIKTKPGTTKTNIEGVFACGDVQDKVYRQAITAAGSGCMAALEVEKYLEEKA